MTAFLSMPQRVFLAVACIVMGWMVFASPPLTFDGHVDARVYCRTQARQAEDAASGANKPFPRNPDGTIDTKQLLANIQPFDFSATYADCIANSAVDYRRLTIQVVVVALVALALVFITQQK
jgi:hypothetical protein